MLFTHFIVFLVYTTFLIASVSEEVSEFYSVTENAVLSH